MQARASKPLKIHKKMLLLTDSNVEKISDIMRQQHLSMAEVCRRAIESYDPNVDSGANEGLEMLADRVIALNQEIIDEAQKLRAMTQETIKLLNDK